MKQVHRHTTLVSCLALMGLQLHAQTPPVASSALPQGAKVVSGQATVTQTAPNALSIGQTSNRAVVDWNSFNIGSQASVQFTQPNASSVVLNRVLDTNPTQIMGRLSANGQVFISNPAGVLFGPTAQVNVAGLVATTQAISTDDFNKFGSALAVNGHQGAVVNQGQITAALGGYIALLAPDVRNEGVLLAREGTVALAAGSKTILQFADSKLVSVLVEQSVMDALVVNKQVIRADGGLVILSARSANAILGSVIQQSGTIETLSLVNREGRVFLDGGTQGLVDMGGQISAAGVAAGSKGGEVVVTGDKVTLSGQARVDASGQAGGGKVLIGGDWQGQNALIRQANEVIVKPGAVLNASALNKGNGGTVVVWSNTRNPNGSTQVQGQLLARGGALGGDGGRIETSGHQLNTTGVQGDASATAGQAGTWLFDPWDVTITSSTSNNSSTAGVCTPSATCSQIANTAINSLLDAGTSVEVKTTGAVTGIEAGNITVNGAISTIQDSANLTLSADTSIIVNNSITLAGSGSTLNLSAGGSDSSSNGFVALGAPVSVDTLNVSVAGTGTVNQSKPLDVNNLRLQASASDVTLTHDNNRIGTVAANVKSLSLSSTQVSNAVSTSNPLGAGLTVGTVGLTSGISATGNVNVQVNNGNLFINDNIATTSTTDKAVILNAGADLSPGAYTGSTSSVNPFGYNILMTAGKTITMGAGGTGKLYTGSVLGSLVVAAHVGTSGLGRYRYNSNATLSNFSLALGTGLNLIYRQNPTLTLTSASQTIVYGNSFVPGTPTAAGFLNTDTSGIALSNLAEALTNNRTSTSGYTRAGTYAITPTATDLLGYQFNTPVTGTLTVSTKPLIVAGVSADSNNKVYDGTTAASLGLSTDKLGIDVVSARAGSTTFADKNVGTGKTITASSLSLNGADAANYSISNLTATSTGNINKRDLTIFGLLGLDKVYDGGTSANLVVNSDDRIAGDKLSFASTASFASKDVGIGKSIGVTGISLSGIDATNYNLLTTSGSTTANITARPLTVTATASDREYNADTVASYTLANNAVSGDTLTIGSTVGEFSDANAGTSKTVTVRGITKAGTDAGNYTLTSTTATTSATILPKVLTASFTAVDKTYDGSTVVDSSTLAITITPTTLVSREVVTATGTASFADKNVGLKVVTLDSVKLVSGSGLASNYSLASGLLTTAKITAKTLTVTAVANNKDYDGTTTASYSLSSTGQITGDLLKLSSLSGVFSDKNAGTGKDVTISGIGISGLDAGNYALSSTTLNTTASIRQKALSASLSVTPKLYDGQTTATGNLTITSGLVGDEKVTATVDAAEFQTKNVVGNNLVTVKSLSLADESSGELIKNYKLDSGQTAVGIIIPLDLTASATVSPKTYDGNTTVSNSQVAVSANLVGSEQLLFTASGNYNNAHVSDASTATIALTMADGTTGLAQNYKLLNPVLSTVPATINKATLTPSLTNTGVTKIYDASLKAPAGFIPKITWSGLVSGDTVVSTDLTSLSASYNDANVKSAKSLTISGLALPKITGSRSNPSDDYVLSTTNPTVAASITHKDQTDSGITAVSKTYELANLFSEPPLKPTPPLAKQADAVVADSVQKRVTSKGLVLPVVTYMAAAEPQDANPTASALGSSLKALSQWSDVQVQSLPAAQVAAMEAPQLKQVLRLLDADSQIRAINPQVLPKVDLQTLAGLSNKQINAFTPAQLANMTKSQINFLMPVLSPAQINALRGKP